MFANRIKREAEKLLTGGPKPWSEEELAFKRYALTDLLDDFEGTTRREEAIFIAGRMAELGHELYLRTQGQWIGSGKWVYRTLKRYDPAFADRFADAFDRFYTSGDKKAVITLIDGILAPSGGRLFAGFTMGKKM